MQLSGRTVLVTGASRGIGTAIVTALAAKGAKLVLAARGAEALEKAAAAIVAAGGVAVAVPTDLEDRASRDRLVDEAERLVGPVDVLVNNAGLESVGRFWELAPEELDRVLAVNLAVPMHLARRVLPGMLERGQGHIVNVASLAGLSVMAHNEAYSASKFGLVGYTRALRASLRHEGSAVSASAVCPGFVSGEGMFANQQREHGVDAPPSVGSSRPDQVADAVVRVVEQDLPELIVNPGPMRPLLALATLSPSLAEWLGPKFGANEVARTLVSKGGVRPK